MWADLTRQGTLDPSHKGPCAVYAKQVSDISNTAAAGAGWFKIFEEGYDDSTSKWCTEKLIDDGGIMSVQIPSGLPSGNYLFRPELLALHNANAGDPQFYTGCAQIQVQGTSEGTLDVPSDYSVSIPGYVKDGDASVSFNIYSPVFPYTVPGPAVYTVPSSSSSVSTTDITNIKAIDGATFVPSNCICKEANWCGVEVADYSTEDGCWAASDECYDQVEVCYASVPPTGNKNCKVFEARCKDIQNACSARSFTGPPNKGRKLEDAEARTGIIVPGVNNLGSGEAGDSNSGSASNVDSGASPVSTAADVLTAVATKATTETTATVTSAYPVETTAASTSGGKKGKKHRTSSTASVAAGSATQVGAATKSAPCERKTRRRRRGSSRK